MAISGAEQVMSLFVSVLMDNEDFKRGLADVQTRTNTAAQNISQKFKSVGTTLQGIGSKLTGWGTALTATVTAPVIGLGIYSGKTAVEFLKLKENTRVAFEVLLGSGEKAEQMLKDLYDFAQGSPLPYQSYLEAGKQLVAMGIAANDVIPYLDKMTNAAIATGKGEAGLDTLATAIGRMSTRGKVSLEELNRMIGMDIPAVKILGNAYGKTEGQIFDMMKKGELLTSEALPKLMDGMEKGTNGVNGLTASYGGLAAKMEGTLTGAIDTVKARFRDMSTQLFDSEKAYPILTNLMYNFSEAIKVVPKLLKGFTAAVTPALANLNNKVKQFTDYINGASSKQLEKISKLILGLVAAGPVLIILGKFISLIGGIASGIGAVIPLITAVTGALGTFGGIMAALPIVGVVAALITLVTQFEGFRDTAKQAFSAVAQAGSNLWSVLSPAFNGLFSILQALGTVAVDGAIAGVMMAFDGLSKSMQWVAEVLSPLTPAFEWFQKTMGEMSNTLMSVFNPLVDKTTEFGDTVSEQTTSAVNDYQELESKATTALNGLLWSGTAVTEDTKNNILQKYKDLKDGVLKILEEQKNGTVQLIKSALQESGVVTEEQNTEILKSVDKYYEDQKISVEEGEKQISEILNRASSEKRALTQEEQDAIMGIQARMQSITVEALSKSKDEQLTIIKKLQLDSGNITAATAAEAVKNSLSQKDGVVKAAEEQCDQTIKAMEKLKVINPQYEDIANQVIEAARKQKEGVVSEAEEMHQKVVDEAKKQSGDHVNEINWETGEVKTTLQQMVETAGIKMSELTTGQKNGWDVIKAGITGNNADIAKSWETTLNDMVDKGFLTNEDLKNMTAEQEQALLDSWSKTDKTAGEKWASIKKKITDNASAAESNATTSASDLSRGASRSFEKTEASASSEFAAMQVDITKSMKNSKSETGTQVGLIERLFSGALFNWPKIKKPHIIVKPPGWTIGDILQGSFPSFSAEWYAKGGILNSPTAFGVNPYSGNLMIGGEAGPEAIAPIDTLQNYVKDAVTESNDKVVNIMSALYAVVAQYLPDLLNRNITLDGKTLVAALADPMDNAFGVTNALKARGSA
jgi:tape measure domain-containing protein